MRDTEETALAVLEATPVTVRTLFTRLPAEIIEAKLDRDWSPKMVLAHFIDTEPVFAERLRRIVQEDHPRIAAIDPLETLEASGYTTRPVAGLLAELERIRGDAVRWLRTLSPDQLARAAEHETAGEVTASQLLHYWPYHDMAHLRQLQRMLSAVLGHEIGPNSENFDI